MLHSAKNLFAECQIKCIRQRGGHSANFNFLVVSIVYLLEMSPNFLNSFQYILGSFTSETLVSDCTSGEWKSLSSFRNASYWRGSKPISEFTCLNQKHIWPPVCQNSGRPNPVNPGVIKIPEQPMELASLVLSSLLLRATPALASTVGSSLGDLQVPPGEPLPLLISSAPCSLYFFSKVSDSVSSYPLSPRRAYYVDHQ